MSQIIFHCVTDSSGSFISFFHVSVSQGSAHDRSFFSSCRKVRYRPELDMKLKTSPLPVAVRSCICTPKPTRKQFEQGSGTLDHTVQVLVFVSSSLVS